MSTYTCIDFETLEPYMPDEDEEIIKDTPSILYERSPEEIKQLRTLPFFSLA